VACPSRTESATGAKTACSAQLGRITGREAHDEKTDYRNPDKRGDHQQQPLEQV
jgi:hypothetical protein